MADNRVNYGARTFSEVKSELIALIEEYYPEILQDFTDSSVGSMIIDLNAGISNNLAINTDRAFQETQIAYAQQRDSILNIAKNLGFNIPNKRPSITVVDFSVNVPVKGDGPDFDYFPTLLPGSQVIGGGKIFETSDIIDWSSSISALGYPNRSYIPNEDSNGIIRNYTVTKREIVINGSTTIFNKYITQNEVVPFYEITLPDRSVLEIDRVILKEGRVTTNPTEADWNNPDLLFYEVDYLAQQRIFIDDPNSGSSVETTGATGIKVGIWQDVTRKFIKEFTSNGFCKLTFGGGESQFNFFDEGFAKLDINTTEFLNNYLSNTALGEKLKKDHTLFIRYRTGGGVSSNVGVNVVNQLGNFTLRVNGARQDYNREVQRSLKVNNPVAAIGGNDGLSTEQIRNLIKYNFSAQNRAVTISDYLFKAQTMNGRYGSAFRANAFRENNKVVLSILGINSQGKLSNTSNTLLKQNITEYMTEFRMVNDYIEVRDGRIFNLAFDVDCYIDNTNENNVANSIINAVANYFNINNNQMNQDIWLGPLIETINNVNGVINVLNVTVYNKVGGQYSSNPVEQALVNEETGQIQLIDNTVYSEVDSQFEILNPATDIRVFLRKKSNIQI
jgi:hypothetical protein